MKKIKILVVMMFLFSILGVINFSMADTYSATENSFTFIKMQLLLQMTKR